MFTVHMKCSSYVLSRLRLLIVLMLITKGWGQIAFEDVTEKAGIQQWNETESLSTAWLDFNQDTLTDLWIGKHKDRFRWPSLYLNQGDGTFVDVGREVYLENPVNDTHGSAWADFDNDGDPDLLETVGGYGGTGEGPNHLFINENGVLENRAAELGVDNPFGRGRMPLWFDYDRDGWLDLLLLNLVADRLDGQEAENRLYRQARGSFVEVTKETGMSITNQSFAFLTDVTNDHHLDLASGNLRQIYDTTTSPFTDVSKQFVKRGNVRNIIVADINGDLRTEILLLRTRPISEGSDIVQPSSDMLAARLTQPGDSFSFQTEGSLKVDFFQTINLDVSGIILGSGASVEPYKPGKIPFFVFPEDERIVGNPACDSQADKPHLLAGYQPETNTWSWQLCGEASVNVMIETEPTHQILNLHSATVDGLSKSLQAALLMFDPQTQTFIDGAQKTGLEQPTSCHSGVAGDFDNDMDVDFFMVCATELKTLPNMVYENMGDGTFSIYTTPTETIQNGPWTSFAPEFDNHVIVADYDLDGFLDVFINSTMQTRSLAGAFLPGTPHQLLRNKGNGKHWLEIDLQGTVSNRDAIGAKVHLLAGGKKQLREQTGGVHRYAQNSSRLHFGLADHARVDEITVYWPSGQVQTLTDIPTNQVLKVTEPSNP
jgi:hypothetical protein